MSYVLSIDDKKIYDFYTNNGLNFTQMNLLLVDILSPVINRIPTETISNNIVISTLSDRFEELLKKQVVELSTASTDCIVNKCKSSFLENANINNVNNVNAETNRKMDELKSILWEQKSAIQLIHHNVGNFLHNYDDVKSNIWEQKSSLQNIYNSLGSFMTKYDKNRSLISEQKTYDSLLDLFSNADVEFVANKKETGDILLTRPNKPKILIENKDHISENVSKQDVDKFIRDCDIQNCCGIMLAHHRGIVHRENFELQLHNGNVLLFVSFVDHNRDLIRVAVEITECLKQKLDELNNEDDATPNFTTIDNETLNEINREYNFFLSQKINIQRCIKDFNDKMNSNLETFVLPSLDTYLGKKYARASIGQCDVQTTCQFCNKPNIRSMKQHYRHCPKKTT
jgi:hypothetical protein